MYPLRRIAAAKFAVTIEETAAAAVPAVKERIFAVAVAALVVAVQDNSSRPPLSLVHCHCTKTNFPPDQQPLLLSLNHLPHLQAFSANSWETERQEADYSMKMRRQFQCLMMRCRQPCFPCPVNSLISPQML